MNIVRQLFEIALNQRSTADLDYNMNAAIACCCGYLFFLSGCFALFNEYSQPLLYASINTTSYILAFTVLLKVHGKENRLVQTLTAIFGTSLILNSIIVTLLITKVFAILGLGLLIYSLVVFTRIIKSSFSCPTYLAVVIFISVYTFSNLMLSIVTPEFAIESQLILKNAEQVEQPNNL